MNIQHGSIIFLPSYYSTNTYGTAIIFFAVATRADSDIIRILALPKVQPAHLKSIALASYPQAQVHKHSDTPESTVCWNFIHRHDTRSRFVIGTLQTTAIPQPRVLHHKPQLANYYSNYGRS